MRMEMKIRMDRNGQVPEVLSVKDKKWEFFSKQFRLVTAILAVFVVASITVTVRSIKSDPRDNAFSKVIQSDEDSEGSDSSESGDTGSEEYPEGDDSGGGDEGGSDEQPADDSDTSPYEY